MMRGLGALLFLPVVLHAQDDRLRTVKGAVVDSLGAPVPFALVHATRQSRVVTDDSGRFQFHSPPEGEIALRVQRLGFKPSEVRLRPVGDTSIIMVLAPIPRLFEATLIEAQRVSRRLDAHGFYDRMADRQKGLGSGHFITIEDIEQRRPFRITQMLSVHRRSISV